MKFSEMTKQQLAGTITELVERGFSFEWDADHKAITLAGSVFTDVEDMDDFIVFSGNVGEVTIDEQ